MWISWVKGPGPEAATAGEDPSYRADPRLTALTYDVPLAELALSPGQLLEASPPNRALPVATTTVSATIRGGDVEGWTPIDVLPDPVAQFRIRSLPETECLDGGGCFDGPGPCVLPCPSVAPPDPAQTPVFDPPPCPEGWSDITMEGDARVCEPFYFGLPQCAGVQTIFPGETECFDLGMTCAPWAENPPAGPRLYVDASSLGGNGTMGSPFATIAAALGQSTDGMVLLLAPGTYSGDVDVGVRVTIVGACPEDTILNGTLAPTIDGVSVQNLTLRSGGIEVRNGNTIEAVDVIIEDADADGLYVSGAGSHATLRRVLIRSTVDGAINVFSGGAATIDQLHAVDTRGVLVDDGTATITRSIIRDTKPNADGDFGRGLALQGAVATVEDTLLAGNKDIGLFVTASELTANHVVVKNTQSRVSDGGAGYGMLVQSGSRADLTGIWLHQNQESNLYVLSEDTFVTLTDSVLTEPMRSDEGAGGYNLQLVGQSSGDVVRTALLSAPEIGLRLADAPHFTATDFWIDGAGTTGMQIRGTTDATLTRVAVTNIGEKGVDLNDDTVSVEAFDLTVVDTGASDCFFCSGICVSTMAAFEGDRIRVAGAHGSALNAQDEGSTLVVRDVLLEDTVHSADCVDNNPNRNFARGVGLAVSEGAAVDVTGFLFRTSDESAVWLASLLPTAAPTELDLHDGLITDNAIGATILIGGYDTRRLADGVRFVGNDTNLVVER